MRTNLLLVFLIFIVGCTQQAQQLQVQKAVLGKNDLCIEEKACIQIERAVSGPELAQGLMFRKSLEENSGMLFVFSDAKTRSFWMKNTLIPLDMIWIGVDKKIVGITKNVQPCRTPACESYSSGKPVKFVLEVNAGFSEKHLLKPGDKAEFLN